MKIRIVLRATAAVAMLFAGAGAAVAGPVIWNSSTGGNGNSYEVVVNNAIDWDGAEAAAESAGGHLATIDSQTEQTFIESVLASTSSKAQTGSYWFGLRETANEGIYQNVTGEPLNYTHWFTGEPNNADNRENAGAILWTADSSGDAGLLARRGNWNDEPVSGYPFAGLDTPAQADVLRGGYIIELDAGASGGTPNAVPLPAAALMFPLGAAFAGLFYCRMRYVQEV